MCVAVAVTAAPGPSAAMMTSSAEASQMIVTADDAMADKALFPSGRTDVNDQQVDLRSRNSWVLKLGEISTPELAEVRSRAFCVPLAPPWHVAVCSWLFHSMLLLAVVVWFGDAGAAVTGVRYQHAGAVHPELALQACDAESVPRGRGGRGENGHSRRVHRQRERDGGYAIPLTYCCAPSCAVSCAVCVECLCVCGACLLREQGSFTGTRTRRTRTRTWPRRR